MYSCPRHHRSETADFCSVCGIEMPPAPPAQARDYLVSQLAPKVAEAGAACPQCGAFRTQPDQAVCPICGFNCQTEASEVPPPPAAAAVPTSWTVVVTADANLFDSPEPHAPVDHPPQLFTLFEMVSVIGRGGVDIRVHVPIVFDEAVSRRQALLTRLADGTLTARDLGSANGTFLNGKPLTPGVDTPVQDGDVIGMGAWTKILIRKTT